jgi:hypothetical protein
MASSRSRWFSKIETRDDALKAIKDASGGFFVLAGIQAALGVIVLKQYSMLFDVAVLVVGAAFLRWFNSRAAAVVLLLLAVVGAGVTVANKFGLALGGGNNVILAALMVWAGVRSVQATFKLHRLADAEAQNSLVRT